MDCEFVPRRRRRHGVACYGPVRKGDVSYVGYAQGDPWFLWVVGKRTGKLLNFDVCWDLLQNHADVHLGVDLVVDVLVHCLG